MKTKNESQSLSSLEFFKYLLNIFLFIFLSSILTFGSENSQLIKNSKQMLLVVIADDSAQTGTLFRFHREMEGSLWQSSGDQIPVVVGRKGLAWSSEENSGTMPNVPKKVEGDDKSPAGVFTLGTCFGFAQKTEMKDLKIPYLQITNLTECIDDQNSQYYNMIVNRDGINNIDWNSSEKMHQINHQYKIGVIVNYNTESPKSGSGSCIFLHIWGDRTEPTSGCTAMSEEHMREIAFWLDKEKNPIIVQLTKSLYNSLKSLWNLPAIHQAEK
jgi:L,D-peptidoglycan transpeptidase YkuD (ErfK/YbiS/YcfS/YnhG family)